MPESSDQVVQHAREVIVKAGERPEEQLGDNLLEEMRRVQRKAWELLAKTESDGDHRASIVALREVRECLESLGAMLASMNPNGNVTLSQRLERAKERLTLEQVLDARERAALADTKISIRFVGPGDEPERDRP